MKGIRCILLTLLVSLTAAYAREIPSVEVHEDGTVTFRYCGNAKKVKLQADFLYVGEDSSDYTDHSKHLRMRKDSTGCFCVTTRPIVPETYTYCFRIDGKRKPDPLNPDTAWQKLHLWNVFTVGGTPKTDLYLQPEVQGHIDEMWWYSTGEKQNRRVNIYVPAAYDSVGEPLDVLYLIHGINGYEGSWTERGRAIQIMENMVAQGRCKPMLIVMPDVNHGAHEDAASLHTMWNSVMHYPKQKRAHYVEDAIIELIHDVDTSYNVSGRNAIAGLSDGARVAANVAMLDPGAFYAVGMFSPVIPKNQTPQDSTLLRCSIDGCVMYSVFIGKSDMFYGRCKKMHKRMEAAGLKHRYTEMGGGHYWRTWRECLIRFLDQIGEEQQ